MRRPVRALLGAVVAVAVLVPATAAFATHFTDIGDSVHKDNIEWLETTGITTGCTATEYCPEDFVKRSQMATFLRRVAGQDPNVPPMVMAAHALEADTADAAGTADVADSVVHDLPFSQSMEAHDGTGDPVVIYSDDNVTFSLDCVDDNGTAADGGTVNLELLYTSNADGQMASWDGAALPFNGTSFFDSGVSTEVGDDLTDDTLARAGISPDQGYSWNPATGDYYSIDGGTLMLAYDGTGDTQTCSVAGILHHFNTNDWNGTDPVG